MARNVDRRNANSLSVSILVRPQHLSENDGIDANFNESDVDFKAQWRTKSNRSWYLPPFVIGERFRRSFYDLELQILITLELDVFGDLIIIIIDSLIISH